MTTRWKLTVEYDGGPFVGWQRQEAGRRTVQETVEDAIYAFCQQRITIHVAGRTDAGVHARGQVAHFDLDYGARPLTGDVLAKALNAHLVEWPVAILKAEEVSPDFHARFSALSKLYTYRILNRQAPPTFDLGRVWHIRRPLYVAAMQEAANHLIGNHDFTTFRDAECQSKSPVKTIDRYEIAREGEEIICRVRGRSFLHKQVRRMTGTLSHVGEGKWTPADVKTALESRDGTKGGVCAPPDGLYLTSIDY